MAGGQSHIHHDWSAYSPLKRSGPPLDPFQMGLALKLTRMQNCRFPRKGVLINGRSDMIGGNVLVEKGTML